MDHSKAMFALALTMSGAILSCAMPAEKPASQESAVLAVLPAGDATAGREAFARLHCTACHQVAGDPGLAPTVAAQPGPVLGPAQASLTQGELVSAIVVPSHSVVRRPEGVADNEWSQMGDFTEVMTVSQLVDLVAYLEQVARP